MKVIIILTVLLVSMSAPSLLAQGKQTRTSSAKAAYGYPSEYNSKKTKKKKKKKQRKDPKRKTKGPVYRKKSPWVN